MHLALLREVEVQEEVLPDVSVLPPRVNVILLASPDEVISYEPDVRIRDLLVIEHDD